VNSWHTASFVICNSGVWVHWIGCC